MTVVCNDCKLEAVDAFQFSSVKNVLPMTGTPILNKPQDLYAQLSLIDPIVFDPSADGERYFLQDYCEEYWPHGGGGKKWRFRPGGLDSLVKQMSSKFVMRDRKTAGITIPPQEIQYYDLIMDAEKYPEQANVMRALNKYALLLLDEEHAKNVLYEIAIITRKRQAITWPNGIKFYHPETKELLYSCEVRESIKIDKIIHEYSDPESFSSEFEYDGLIPELVGIYDEDNGGTGWDGERVVVFSQFKEPLKEIEHRCALANIPAVRYDGDTKDYMREKIQLDFDATYCNAPDYKQKYQVVLCNYKSGGVGLNFTGASQMIILDEEWSPGKEDQAFGRIDRMGQTKETTVHVLRVQNSIDTWLKSINDEKRDMVDGFESSLEHAQSLREAIEGGLL